MPLPLNISCFSEIHIGFAFLVPAHPGSPGQRVVKRVCVCVCVGGCVCVIVAISLFLYAAGLVKAVAPSRFYNCDVSTQSEIVHNRIWLVCPTYIGT